MAEEDHVGVDELGVHLGTDVSEYSPGGDAKLSVPCKKKLTNTYLLILYLHLYTITVFHILYFYIYMTGSVGHQYKTMSCFTDN